MLNRKRRTIDRDNRHGQVFHALRIGGANPGRFLIELIAMHVASIMTFGFVPVPGPEFTGSQHDLSDLRRHSWLAAKYGKPKRTSATADDQTVMQT
jgi:hypothetical protein